MLYVPDAVADHYYEFGRTPLKMYLVERNRLITVLTAYPTPLLRATVPALLVLEPAFLLLAIRQGWVRQKVDGWSWIFRHRKELRERRRRVQRLTTVENPSSTLAAQMISRIEPPMVEHPPGMGLVNATLAGYWRAVGRMLHD